MNPRHRLSGVLVAAVVLALAPGVLARPPAHEDKKASPTPAPSPADTPGSASLLSWLLLQNGGPGAASVGWTELVRTAAGRQVLPVDAAAAPDQAVLAKLGVALDSLLPSLNRPDGALRSTAVLTMGEITARIDNELRSTLASIPGAKVDDLSDPATSPSLYPVLRWTDAGGGKAWYFGVAPYSTGGREGALQALTLRAAESSKRLTTDGSCLLIGLEHNGKTGREFALLNWELIDLAKVSVRCDVVFDADQAAVHSPGATLTDGRKGRD